MSDRSNWPSGFTNLSTHDNHAGLESTTADERVGMMWQLAIEAWGLKGESVVELEFRRDISGIVRLSN